MLDFDLDAVVQVATALLRVLYKNLTSYNWSTDGTASLNEVILGWVEIRVLQVESIVFQRGYTLNSPQTRAR